MTNDQINSLSKKPLLLNSTTAWRPYTGGKKIREWQGIPDSLDNEFPEEWIASTVKARNVGQEDMDEGLTTLNLENHGTIYLRDLISMNPRAFLGKDHIKKYRDSTAVLAKIIDSQSRLPLQVHPDNEFAKKEFNSAFGKTEAWFIMSTRETEGIDPYLLIGFKKEMTKEKWKRIFWEQNTEEMIGSLHRIPAQPGEVFLIEGGVPHAIGPGYMLIEIQEPTDYTIRLEKKSLNGRAFPDSFYHQGVGYEKMFDCFNYKSLSYEETLEKYRIKPHILRETTSGKETELIGPPVTKKFKLRKLDIRRSLACKRDEAFSTLVVLSGEGNIITTNNETPVKKGDILFLPASLEDFLITNASGPEQTLEMVRCYPPSSP